jgi:hypothetical protein
VSHVRNLNSIRDLTSTSLSSFVSLSQNFFFKLLSKTQILGRMCDHVDTMTDAVKRTFEEEETERNGVFYSRLILTIGTSQSATEERVILINLKRIS